MPVVIRCTARTYLDPPYAATCGARTHSLYTRERQRWVKVGDYCARCGALHPTAQFRASRVYTQKVLPSVDTQPPAVVHSPRPRTPRKGATK